MINRLLRRLTVQQRITGLFLIFVLLLGIAIPLVVINQSFLLNRLQQVTDVETETDRLLLVAAARVASSRVNLIRYIQDYAPSTYEAADDVDQAVQLLTEAHDLMPPSSDQQTTVILILDALEDYRTLIAEIEAARQTGDDVNANRLQFQAFRFGNDISQRIELMVKESQARVAETNLAINTEAQTRVSIFIVGYISALILGAILAILVARSLTRPIAELRSGAEALRAGDVDTVIPVAGRDELSLLAQTFNELTAQLSESYRNLEQRIADRTHRLETVAALSDRLVAILNVEELLNQLVNRVKNEFDYYHAHVYLVDEKMQNLMMTAGVGEAGAQMKAEGHHIPMSAPTSLVARAARTGEVVSVDNVREAPDWLPNKLLPNTYSEMAVPIILDGKVVGVLDIQQDKEGGLDEGDENLLRSLANQAAVAIRNARLFAEVETALVEARAAQEKYIADAWQKINIVPKGNRHLYTPPDIPQVDKKIQGLLAETHRQALEQEGPTILEGERKTIVAPIRLGQQKIGALQIHNPNSDSEPQEELAIVAAILDQFAQSAETLRLFDETRQRAGREQTIREITEKLRAAPNLEALLKTATTELGEYLTAGHTIIDFGIEDEPEPPETSPGHNGNHPA